MRGSVSMLIRPCSKCPGEDYEKTGVHFRHRAVGKTFCRPFRAALILLAPFLFSSTLFLPILLRAQAPAKGLAKDEIIRLLDAGVAPKRVEALIEDRGISFELTPQAEQDLRQAGADSDLIEVVRAHSKPTGPPELVVESKPGNAQIFVDNELFARTSSGGWAKITTLAPGRHSLRVAAEGYADFEQAVELKAGQVVTVSAVLERPKFSPATLIIESRPARAAVYVDGKLIGGTGAEGKFRSADLAPGTHRVRVSAEGYADFEQSVELVAARAVTVTALLEPAKPSTAGLVLEAIPRGASVTVDDRLVDKSSPGGNLNIQDIPPGRHRVRVTAEGYAPFEQTIEISAGSILTLRPSLLPLAPSAGLARDNLKDGLKYVWVPPGTFMMGCSPGESNQCLDDERPSHRVTISRAFWLGQTEVTVGAYKRFVAATKVSMPIEPVFGNLTLNPGWAGDFAPIVNVSRADADDYCSWAGGRLPTEAEWEYAARAGSAEGRYGPVDEVAWYANNSGRGTLDSELIWKQEQTKFSERLNANGNTFHAVGLKKPNAYNLYDILGNVWEWVGDWYDEKYYSKSAELDPRGPSSGQFGVQRGGSWFTGPRVARAAPRYRVPPESRGFSIGIRCARDAAP